MAKKDNLYKILMNIFEQDTIVDKEELDDIKNIRKVVKTYSIIKDIKNISITFGYSDLGLNESQKFEEIKDNDFVDLPKEEQEQQFETDKEFIEIKNSNVLSILKYIKRKIENKMKDKVLDQKNKPLKLPFIIKISWHLGSIEYSLETNYFEEKLTVVDYQINKSKNQVNKIKRFIDLRKKYIKNSPFRLLGSIFIFNDWYYDWNIEAAAEGLKRRKIKPYENK
jgi:hypothetical protein